MHRLPERLPPERRRSSRPGKARRPTFPPGVRAVGLPPSAYAHNPISTALFAPSPVIRSADVVIPPRIWTPDSPGFPRPPSSFAPAAPSEQPDSLPPRPDSPYAGLDPARQEPHPVVIGGATVLQLRELVNLRSKDIGKRSALKNGVKDIVYQWQYAEDAQQSFMNACTALMASVSNLVMDTIPGQNLHNAWDQLQNLSGHVKSREMGLVKSLNELLQLENRLAMKEAKVYQKLNGLFGGGASDTEDEEENFETEHLRDMPAPSRASSTTTCSIAHEYYSRVGEINLLKEEIFNFDSEHRKQEFIRETQRKAGQHVEPPDKIFYQRFLDEKAAMVQKYFLTKEKMEEIRESCERQNVPVDEPNLPAFLDHSLRLDRSLHDQSGADKEEKLETEAALREETAFNILRTERWADSTRVNKPMELPMHEIWDSLSETTDPRNLDWRHQQAEGELAFPAHDQFVPWTSLGDDEAIKGGEREVQTRYTAVDQGEVPVRRRRYSAPELPTFKPRIPLQHSVLEEPVQDQLPDLADETYWEGVGILTTSRWIGAVLETER